MGGGVDADVVGTAVGEDARVDERDEELEIVESPGKTAAEFEWLYIKL